MPLYRYDALDSRGKPVKGDIEAADQETAMREVVAQSLMPTGIREVRSGDDADPQPTNKLGKWFTVGIVIILAALALLGSLSRTNSEEDRQALPAESSERPATNNTQ